MEDKVVAVVSNINETIKVEVCGNFSFEKLIKAYKTLASHSGYVVGNIVISMTKFLFLKFSDDKGGFSIFIENGEVRDLKEVLSSNKMEGECSVTNLSKGREVLLAAMNAMGKKLSDKELDNCVKTLEEYEIEPNYNVLERKEAGLVCSEYKDGRQLRRERRKAERTQVKLLKKKRYGM